MCRITFYLKRKMCRITNNTQTNKHTYTYIIYRICIIWVEFKTDPMSGIHIQYPIDLPR